MCVSIRFAECISLTQDQGATQDATPLECSNDEETPVNTPNRRRASLSATGSSVLVETSSLGDAAEASVFSWKPTSSQLIDGHSKLVIALSTDTLFAEYDVRFQKERNRYASEITAQQREISSLQRERASLSLAIRQLINEKDKATKQCHFWKTECDEYKVHLPRSITPTSRWRVEIGLTEQTGVNRGKESDSGTKGGTEEARRRTRKEEVLDESASR